jgi:hypothetical protein
MDDTTMDTVPAARPRVIDLIVLAVVISCAALLVFEVGTNLQAELAGLRWGF